MGAKGLQALVTLSPPEVIEMKLIPVSKSQKSSLIVTSNYHTYYLAHYPGDLKERNRAPMIKYGLADLKKLFGRRDKDPH